MNGGEDPACTVVVATFNGEKLLPALIQSVKAQRLGAEAMVVDIVVVDGGSSDATVPLALRLGCRVVHNIPGDVANAKTLGFKAARTDLVCVVDQDERLVNVTSLSEKISFLERNPLAVAVVGSGYIVSKDFCSAQNYQSEFGDPVNALIYRFPNSHGRREAVIRRRLAHRKTPEGALVFDNRDPHPWVPIEFGAQGAVVSRGRLRDLFDSSTDVPIGLSTLSDLFSYAIGAGKTFEFGFIPNDPIVHEPSTRWNDVFSKVRWRVLNALDESDGSLRRYGIRGRIAAQFPRLAAPIERALAVAFGLFVALLIPVLAHAIWLALSRRQIGMLMHFPLSVFVLLIAAKVIVLRSVSRSVENKRYDGSKSESGTG